MGQWLVEAQEVPRWVLLLGIVVVLGMFAYLVWMTRFHENYENGLYAYSKRDAERLEAAQHRITSQQTTIAVLKSQLSQEERRNKDLAKRARLLGEETTLDDKQTRVLSSRKPHPDQWNPNQ